MKLKPAFFLFLITIFTLPVFAQGQDAILGKWLNASGEGQIMIIRKGGKYAGNLVWLKQPHNEKGQLKRDTRNPNPAFHSRPLIGTEILRDFTFSGKGVWEEGFIYDPKTGKTYSSRISLVGSDKLSIRGYVGISLLGRTEIWTRVQ